MNYWLLELTTLLFGFQHYVLGGIMKSKKEKLKVVSEVVPNLGIACKISLKSSFCEGVSCAECPIKKKITLTRLARGTLN